MPQPRRKPSIAYVVLAAVVAASIAALFASAPQKRTERQVAASGGLNLTDPLPAKVGKDTILTVGDPVTQWIFEHEGWNKQLPFTIRWAQITGGPDVTEAFHAKALDVGVGANIPPIHATWVGLPVRIIAVRQRRDPLQHPSFVWGIAPGAGIDALRDLKGKRIAFSPSQVQSQVVAETLRAIGLTAKDVTLVELPSSIGGDVYTSALGSNAVDAAPIGGGIVAERYLRKFGADGGKVLQHPPFRDDLTINYVPVSTLENPGKAAALAIYVRYWVKAQQWQQDNRAELARGYYVKHQGLPPADAEIIIKAAGDIELPANWDDAHRYQQAAIDLMAAETGRPRFDATTLFDPRFESLATARP
ncbi:sulfonate transport system substrate-binding protein [Sphingopyxis panaciterrae]|uniref:ABC transporter substrate-binding protein n=1 Tax=Sphingopyxis panaciterrae TaxID=363841 RepID=UPI001422065E|nr:ABC transporter substrate-binding protein [Sphingopyxis panaciterrae]NIJ37366.1 sulfonate transport system substrate-binding protein [Sphingopyxis panaciterrae]